jgi:hypothetical protein
VRRYGTHATHLGASVTDQKSPCARWWSRTVTSKLSSTNIIKVAQRKGIGATCRFAASPEVGPGATVGTLQTGYTYAQDLKDQPHGTRLRTRQERAPVPLCVPTAPDLLPMLESSSSAMYPMAQSTPPTRRGLRCRHMPHGTEPVTRQGRAPESQRVSWLLAHPLRRKALASPCDRGTRTTARQGSDIVTCPMAPDPPPGAGGF